MSLVKLQTTFENCNSVLCIGLDVDAEVCKINVEEISGFCLDIVYYANTQNLCFTFKLNYAFFSQYGIEGLEQMAFVIDKIKKENFVILDYKRADIPNTMERYAKECFDVFNADAATFVPFFGFESVLPLYKKAVEKDRLIYVIAKPTNKGAEEVVNARINNDVLWESIINNYSTQLQNIGFVVPPVLDVVKKYKDFVLLFPGVGKQGYDATEVVKFLSWKHRINVSRAILEVSSRKERELIIDKFSRELKIVNV